jgi:hypothetical protein
MVERDASNVHRKAAPLEVEEEVIHAADLAHHVTSPSRSCGNPETHSDRHSWSAQGGLNSYNSNVHDGFNIFNTNVVFYDSTADFR